MRQLFFVLGLGLLMPLANAEPDAAFAASEFSAVLGTALPDTALSDQRGRANINNKNDVDGAVFNNMALNTVSGDNIVTDGALASSTGLFTVIQNSGNNVLIQNATILNLNVQ